MKLPLLFSLSLTLLLGTLSAAQANSPCKGLANEACHSNEQCRWIEPYTTQRGTSVKAYCRSQAKKRSTSATDKPLPEQKTIPKNNTPPSPAATDSDTPASP